MYASEPELQYRIESISNAREVLMDTTKMFSLFPQASCVNLQKQIACRLGLEFLKSVNEPFTTRILTPI